MYKKNNISRSTFLKGISSFTFVTFGFGYVGLNLHMQPLVSGNSFKLISEDEAKALIKNINRVKTSRLKPMPPPQDTASIDG